MKKKEEKIRFDEHDLPYYEVGEIAYNGKKIIGVEYPFGEDNYRCYRSTDGKLYLGNMITIIPEDGATDVQDFDDELYGPIPDDVLHVYKPEYLIENGYTKEYLIERGIISKDNALRP